MHIEPLNPEAIVDPELRALMEPGAFIAFHYGMQAFARTLDANPRPSRGLV